MPKILNVEHAMLVVELESRRYLSDIGLLKNLSCCYSMPIARYILSSSMCLPVKTIIVGERPYATDIHPFISSAMSYNDVKSRPTPSTIGTAVDLSINTATTYLEAENWFRDGWKYLSSGTLIVNCNVFIQFSSSMSQSETLPFQKWLRCILDYSMLLSSDKIDVICMGIPSQNVVDPILRSIGMARGGVNKRFCPNPASISKRNAGDLLSRNRTLGNKTVSKSISLAIQRSKASSVLSVQDYIDNLCKGMSSQVPQVGKLIQAANDVAAQIDDAYKELENNHKLPNVRDAVDTFAAALIEYRDSVLKDIVISSMSEYKDSSSKIGKATEWGNKKAWKKPESTIGDSSKMSVVAENNDGVEQKFADEEEESLFLPDSAQVTPEVKKKKTIRKVVRKRKVTPMPEVRSEVGSNLGDSAVVDLKAVRYYISEVYPGESESLEHAVSQSIETGKAYDQRVCDIVDISAMEFNSHTHRASFSLGIDTGDVSESSSLPKLIAKFISSSI